MKRLTFLEKTQELSLYTQRYETITFFEISQLYGASLAALLIFILSVPLIVFSTQWIALPCAFLIVCLSSLLFFDERVWLLDSVKRIQMPAKVLDKVTGGLICAIQWIQKYVQKAAFYAQFEKLFRYLNPLILLFAAFQVGFVQAPDTSIFPVLALLFVSLDCLLENGYFSLAGLLFFLIGLI